MNSELLSKIKNILFSTNKDLLFYLNKWLKSRTIAIVQLHTLRLAY